MTALRDQMHAFANGRPPEQPQAIDGQGIAVTFDKNRKLILPPVPGHDDPAGLCSWLTVVFALDPRHPITGAEHQGVAGPNGHVEIRRTDAPSIRIEPITKINAPQKLIPELNGWLLPTDGAIPAIKGEHCRDIAYVVRMLCGRSARSTAADEASGIVRTFLNIALAVEGLTTHGTTAQRYEAARRLTRAVDELSGRPIGPIKYLLDSATGEIVIRVGDLALAGRVHTGGQLPHGWLDARMDAIGWSRVCLSGYSIPGREGRRTGHHARCDVYRGQLAGDDDDQGSVNT